MSISNLIAVVSAVIAVASVLVGWLAVSAARTSARNSGTTADAAQRSARAAEGSLPLARKAAEAAVDSAAAAQRSADVAEAQHHRELGPKWTFSFGDRRGRQLPITATFQEGPNQVAVQGWFQGEAAAGAREGCRWHDVRLVHGTIPRRDLVRKNDPVHFAVELPDDIETIRAAITVTLHAEETGNPEGNAPSPWWHPETVHWEKKEPFVMWA